MHNNCYPVNSNDNGTYSGSYTELVSNNQCNENDFANIFLLNEQTNQLQTQLYVNSHNDHHQNNYSAQIETHLPEFQYSINNTDYVMSNYQHNQSGKWRLIQKVMFVYLFFLCFQLMLWIQWM